MATTFVDSSAFYAYLDARDRFHRRAVGAWDDVTADDRLVTHSYVLIETAALLQSRLGTAAVRDFHDDLVPVVTVQWVDEATHLAAVAAVVASERRSVSLVDRVSFLVMRRRGISRAMTFDPQFAEAGFQLVG